MLDIKSIQWKNFMSYGDEISELKLEELGQVLITGEVIGDTDDGLRRSNGSGKSTIPNIILWALFGRTMHSPNPGNAVINHHTGKDCWVKLTFKNGDSITRTRGTKNHNELIYIKNGEESSLSTSKNLQAQLIKDLNLDYELFTASSFFTQYSKSWLEMADNSRKKALERILHVDRFVYYASEAKKQLEKCEQKLEKIRQDINQSERTIEKHKNQIEQNAENINSFEEKKIRRINSISSEIETLKTRLSKIIPKDLDKIKKIWDTYDQINAAIKSMKDEKHKLNNQIETLASRMRENEQKISNWTKKEGKQCLSCLQDIPHSHISQNIEPYKAEQESLKERTEELSTKYKKQSEKITLYEQRLREREPKTTIREAEADIREIKSIKKDIESKYEWLEEAKSQENPYTKTNESFENFIIEETTRLEHFHAEKEKTETLYKHYHFIWKAYSERNKIKSYIFKRHIPYINHRLNHYMDMLNLDTKISLSENLSIDTNSWSYDFQSGGERKRTDIAFMLATFDFHEATYGKQSNILVLDEVDGRMDDEGIEGLINIIKQELAPRIETIIIISHRNQMHDVFDKELRVIKENKTSRIKIM